MPWNPVWAFWGREGNLPRQDCHPAGQAPSYGPRRGLRDPGMHSEVLGAGSVRIWARSCAVPTGPSGGVVSSQRHSERLSNAQAEGHQSLRGRVLRSLGERYELRRLPRARFLPLADLCSILVLAPSGQPNSTRSRHAAPALALVVPSERPCATQRHRFGGVQAPWTVERRAGCSSVPAGSW